VTNAVRVRFPLEVDDDGWPPFSSEGVWAIPLGGDRYLVQNTPWFVRALANGDVVRATPDGDGVLWASERLEWSGYLTGRAIPIANGPLDGDPARVLEVLAQEGVSGEGFGELPIVSIEISPADVVALKRQLVDGEANGLWHFEEGCVSQTWLDA
jgi:hypothetical protein